VQVLLTKLGPDFEMMGLHGWNELAQAQESIQRGVFR
jgi:hypothetical protein